MADSKYTPAPTEPPKEAPPSYDVAAVEHGTLPVRPAGKPLLRPFPLDIPVLAQLKGKRIILASASPRRKQLLAQIGLVNLEVVPSTKPENFSKTDLSPFEYVHKTANQKLLDVYQTALDNSIASIRDPDLVIAADTIVVTTGGKILEKPRSEADHIAMLTALRDQKVHRVFTAVGVLAPREDARSPGYNSETCVEETKVVFDKEISDEMILAYVKTREGVDKAGGYAVQGIGALLIEKIDGSYDNVVGLPVRKTLGLIERCVLNQDDEEELGSGDEE